MKNLEIDIREYINKIDELFKLVKEVANTNLNNSASEDLNAAKELKVKNESIFKMMGIKKVDSINYEDLLNRIQKSKNQLEKIEATSDKEFSEYNIQYINYIKSLIRGIANQVDIFFKEIELGKKSDSCNQQIIINIISRLNLEFQPNINELFEHFKYGNKNYVIFGKNGAGKTSLLKYISSSIFTNAIVIPARRTAMSYDGSSISISNDFNLNKALADNYSLTYLVKELNDRTMAMYERGVTKDGVLKTKFYDLFTSLGLDRNIIIFKDSLLLYGDQINKYPINQASDGERSIAYLIMATLLAPQHSYLFIDEPENHLNGALMRNLFDKLEAERPDLRFIYLTHVIDFVESRKNVELVYLKKSRRYGDWQFIKIEDYSNISLDVVLSIEGTKKDVIFCEGNRSSIDCQILECLFPEYEIKPVESCEQVKLHVRGINGLETSFRRRAFGVIDNDYMSQDEIQTLNKNRIYPIGYNEWENFLIQSKILEYINLHHLNKDVSSIKNNVVRTIKGSGKNAILNDFVTKKYTKILYATKLRYDENFNKRIDKINLINKNTLISEVDKLSKMIDDIEDYDSLVSIIPAKMLLDSVAKGIGLHSGDDYVQLIIKYLSRDKDFNKSIKQLLNINLD